MLHFQPTSLFCGETWHAKHVNGVGKEMYGGVGSLNQKKETWRMCNIACYQYSPLLIYIYLGTLHWWLQSLFFFFRVIFFKVCCCAVHAVMLIMLLGAAMVRDSQILWKCSFHTCILVLEEALPTVFLLTKAYIFILGGLRYQFGSDFEMG